jgi:hypothetical protein
MQGNLTTLIRLPYDDIIKHIPKTGIMDCWVRSEALALSWNDGLKKPAFKTPIISLLQHHRRIFK